LAEGLGLSEYEGVFLENEVEADILPDLTEADLEKTGLPLGPGKRLLKNRGEAGGSPSPRVLTFVLSVHRQLRRACSTTSATVPLRETN